MKKNDLTENQPSISIIIPTLNGAEQLRELLASFTIQTLKPSEVIVIDSSSVDDTVRVAAEYNAEIVQIDLDDFDHGGTRTMAGKRANGEILIYLTQDVLPSHRFVLENLVAPLCENNEIAVSYGRQLPSFNAGEIAEHLRFFNYPEQSYVRSFSDRKNFGLGTVFTSNSCAAYRKSLLEEVGFFKNDLIFGEDTCAVGRLLEKGLKIAYAADAAVYHSHNYDWGEDFRRYFDIGVLHTVENWLITIYGDAQSRGKKYVRSGVLYLYQRRRYSLIGDFMVRTLLKYLGYQLGRNYKKLPQRIIPELSLNKRWWKKSPPE